MSFKKCFNIWAASFSLIKSLLFRISYPEHDHHSLDHDVLHVQVSVINITLYMCDVWCQLNDTKSDIVNIIMLSKSDIS